MRKRDKAGLSLTSEHVTFEVRWMASKFATPDYDYTAKIGGFTGSAASTNGYVIDDPQGILGIHEESTYDFAVGKTGMLYIPKVSIVLTNEYPNIPISPISDNTPGKKWVIATFPAPVQVNVDWSVQILGMNNADANVKYQRGASDETDVEWSGTPGYLNFTNGWLNAAIRLNDGSNSVPQMSLSSNNLIISSVQQGDRIIIEYPDAKCRDELAVVKNFSWNDLQRFGATNLMVHSSFASISNAIRDAVMDSIIFCLDPANLRDQKMQLTNDCFPDSGLSSVIYTNFHAAHTNLLLLDIPSARSIGIFPDDYNHWHMGLETASLPSDIASKTNDLTIAANISWTTFPAFQSNTVSKLVDLLNTAYGKTNTSFILSHTYEGGEAHDAEYLDPGGGSITLKPGDPIRNIRWEFNTSTTQELSYPGNEDNANEWKKGETEPPQEIWSVEMFVNRNGKVVFIGSTSGLTAYSGLISDALREE